MKQTKTKTDDGVLDQWPPLAHLTRDHPVMKGSLALCGKKLMGIDIPTASKVCKKCTEIADRVQS